MLFLKRGIGYIKADTKSAANAFLEWQNDVLKPYGSYCDVHEMEMDSCFSLNMLNPFSAPVRTKYLFSPAGDGWTAFHDNGLMCADPASAMSVLSKLMSVRTVRVQSCEDLFDENGKRREYGGTIFEVFEAGETIRYVYSVNDDRWKFGQRGHPFEFENLSDYEKKSIKERFNIESLLRYMSSMGIAFNLSVSAGDVVLLERRGNLPDPMKYVTVELST